MATSHDAEELKEAWVAWRDESGKKMQADYLKYVELGNKAAQANGD